MSELGSNNQIPFGYVSSREASRIFHVSNDYVARLCRTGKVKGLFIGKIWYVEESSLDDFLESMEGLRRGRSKELSRQRRKEYQQSVQGAVYEKAQSVASSTAAKSYAHGLSYLSRVAIALTPILGGIAGIALFAGAVSFAQPAPQTQSAAVSFASLPDVFGRLSDAISNLLFGPTPAGNFAVVPQRSNANPTRAQTQTISPPSLELSDAAAPATSTPTSTNATVSPSVSTPVAQTVVQNIVQRVIEQGVTQEALTTQLQELRNDVLAQLYSIQSAPSSAPATGGVTNNIALSQRIDNLDGTTLTNVKVNGISGLTAGDIPTLSYLSLAGGTLTGQLFSSSTATTTFDQGINVANGCFAVNGVCVGTANAVGSAGQIQFTNGSALAASSSLAFNNTTGLFSVVGTASTTNLVISGITNGSGQCLQVNASGQVSGTGSACGGTGSTPGGSSGTVQFNDGGVFNGATGLTYDKTNVRIGVGSSTPWAQLAVNPNGITGPAFAVGSSTATSFIVTNAGSVGVGTTSPAAAFAVGGNAYVSGSLTLGSALAIINGGTGATSFAGNSFVTTNAAGTALIATSSNVYVTTITATGTTASVLPYASSTALTVSGTASTSNLIASNTFTFSNISGFLKATAGVVSNSLVNLASDVSGVLPVTNGGTGWAAIQSGSIPYGNGTGALATTTAGTNGQVLALVGGVPTWQATTTFSSGLQYSNGNVTNTGVLSVTGTANQITASASTGNVTLSLPSLVSLTNASSSQLSVFQSAYFGGTATSTFASDGTLTLAHALALGSGGTNNSTDYTSNSLLYYDGTRFVSTSTEPLYVGALIATSTRTASGIGTTTPWGTFAINPVAGQASNEFVVGSSTATSFLIANNGNVGVGTTSPGSLFAINNVANFTAATSSFYGTGGINLAGGCFAVNGTCVSSGGGSGTPSGSNTQIQFNSNGSFGGAADLTYVNGNVAIASTTATSTPWAALSINADGLFGPAFAVGSSTATNFVIGNNGRVGVGTSTPAALFAVGGNSYFGGTLTSNATAASIFPYASTTAVTVSGTASTTNLVVSGLGVGSTQCLQINSAGQVSATGAGCGGSGSTPGGGAGAIQFNNGTTFAGVPTFTWDNVNGYFGVGTSTPYTPLSVWGGATSTKIAEFVTAASTTALSIAEGGFSTTTVTGLTINGSATSTSNVGFNVTAGCYAVNGTCLSSGGGSGTPGGSNGQIQFNNNSSFGGATDLTYVNGNLGVGSTTATSTPWAALSINANGLFGPSFAIGSSTATQFVVTNGGSVGIGTTSPAALFAVGGNSYFGGTLTSNATAASTFPYASSTAVTVSGTASTTNLVVSGSTTLGALTGFLKATAGVVSTAAIDLASDVTGILPVGNGGTGWGNIQANTIVLGNGSGAIATTTAGTNGQVLALLNGVPSWVATTTLSTISGTLAVGSGGTGATSFAGNSFITSNAAGTALIATSSNVYVTTITATSTSASSTIGFALGVGSSTPWGTLGVSTQVGNPAFAVGSSTGTYFLIDKNGNVGVGTLTPQALFAVAGTASTTNLNVSGVPGALLSTNASGGLQSTSFSGPLSFSGSTLTLTQSNGSTNGYLSSTDWNTFNNKVSSTSLSGASVISYNSSTGVITTAPGTFGGSTGNYNFPSGTTASIASTTPWATFAINPTAGVASNQFVVGSSTATNFVINNAGNVGIGTTSPGTLFSIGNSGGISFSGSATTTFGSSVNGINITNGCFAVNGTCITSGGGGTPGGSNGQIQFNSNSSFGALSNSFYNSSSGRIGLGTTTPSLALLSIASSTEPQLTLSDGGNTNPFTLRAVNGNLFIATSSPTTFATSSIAALTINSNGFLGVGTTSPSASLSTAGALYVGGTATSTFAGPITSQSGNLILSAAGTTNSLLLNPYGGNVGVGTTSPGTTFAVQQTIGSPQFTIGYSNALYATFQVTSAGDLIVNTQSTKITMTNDNLWVCNGGACPTQLSSDVSVSGTGNFVFTNKLYFGNGFSFGQTAGTTTAISVFDASSTEVLRIDQF